MTKKATLPIQNRELTWLEFNQRVLDQAADPKTPLLERVKFLAISASNLDEFFLVRVGGLVMLEAAGSRTRDPAGFTVTRQLSLVRQRVELMVREQARVLNDMLVPALAKEGIRRLAIRNLRRDEIERLHDYFEHSVAPLVTALAVHDDGPVARPPALQLILGCELLKLSRGGRQSSRWALVTIPPKLPRFVPVPRGSGYHFVLLEDIVAHFAGMLFPGETLGEQTVFRITRNADIAVNEEGAVDLAREMEAMLAERRMSRTIRLEVTKGCPRRLLDRLRGIFGTDTRMVNRSQAPVDLAGYMALGNLLGFEKLKDEPWNPQPHPAILPDETIFETLERTDLLLYHPYDSFDPVLQLIEQAADDPEVVAIKQTLYRTARNSRIITALIRAAENGKQVTVIVELKARFDEARNLHRADALENAGVQLIYGVAGYKTHSKILMVVRKTPDGEMRTFLHFGTGNYNESTANLYTDVSYLTCRSDYGMEAVAFFNALTGESEAAPGAHLCAAPHFLRRRFLDLIAEETTNAKAGKTARIVAKINSFQDAEIIAALYEASKAGVTIRLNVRGICCLVPGLKGISENIEVTSIIDRFLEHARIFYFHRKGKPAVFISSADWMERNLDRRVELLVAIDDPDVQRRLVKLLTRHFKDNDHAYRLESDGTYARIKRPRAERRYRAQREFFLRARKRIETVRKRPGKYHQPHLPPGVENGEEHH